MKYIRFQYNDEVMYGTLANEQITKLSGDFLDKRAVPLDETYDLNDVKVLSPVNPGKMVAIGLNYEEHAKEQKKPIPEEPMMFMVSPTAVINDDEEILLPTTDRLIEFEAELAVVIGTKAKNVKKQDALSYVFGYTCANDVSDRDLQKKDGQYTRAKSFDTFKPLGPVIATELNPNNLNISLESNGEVRQNSNTSDLIHDVESVIEHVTEVMTLYPGDVLLTGTPSGVGALRSGDRIEIEIEGIGKLKNQVG
ncbi:hypothetical protein CFK37_10565 [Virgibacillus phasianinus]|uniref:2-hydroxyhepta-2,4-diene-1,7-dioate isomerase n=1 Tax=Virgibacillus phasianinus TaxID=2017483 RepID=A0A220U341_9BACI|nr:fumarylacetoacetate hydrolase family protein [Virgibacillus phasianinus]ASK62559.1 hypothetical protein CFK37_10565 [Virgibacillus phasianinus]